MGVKVQAQEGDTTIAMKAPIDLKEGDVLRFFGFPFVALSDAVKGRRCGFQKRGTLRYSHAILRALNGGQDVDVGVLKGVFEQVPGTLGWERLTTLVDGTDVIGLVEGFSRPPNFVDDVYLDMATGGGAGGGGSAGDPFDAAATEARFVQVEDENDDQDQSIQATELDVVALQSTVAQLEALVAGMGPGEGVNLQPILDDIADLKTQTVELASTNTLQWNSINYLYAQVDAIGQNFATLSNRIGALEAAPGVPQVAVLRQDNFYAIAPGATRRMRFYASQALLPSSPKIDPASNDANGYGSKILMPSPTMHEIAVQLRPFTLAGEQPYEAGSSLAISIVDHDDVTLDFIGRVQNAAGFWSSKRVATIAMGGSGRGFAIDLTNTHETDTLYLDDAGAAIVIHALGKF